MFPRTAADTVRLSISVTLADSVSCFAIPGPLSAARNGNGNFRYFFSVSGKILGLVDPQQNFVRRKNLKFFREFFQKTVMAGRSVGRSPLLSYLTIVSNGRRTSAFIIVRTKGYTVTCHAPVVSSTGQKEKELPILRASSRRVWVFFYLRPCLKVRPLISLSLLSWLIPMYRSVTLMSAWLKISFSVTASCVCWYI